MNTKLFALLLAGLTGFSANAQAPEPIVIHAGKIPHINIASDLQVVLLQAPTGDESLSMSKPAQEKLKVTSNAASLHIDGAGSIGEPIYLFVEDLRTITLGSNALVETSGMLLAPEINIYVEENAKAILRTKGKVNGFSLTTEEVNIKRRPILPQKANPVL